MNIVESEGLIVILRDVPLSQVSGIAEALYEGGVRVVEVAFDPGDTNTIQKTSALIEKIYAAVGDSMFVGAGTVINTDFLMAAYHSSAKFIFSPNVNVEVIRLTKKIGMMSLPGAYTPSEILTAYENGADMVKLFPVTTNEIGYIKNIMRPLSHIPFLCVGGTNETTTQDFFEAGAKAVGTGVSILKPELIMNKDYEAISQLAKLHVEQVRQAQKIKFV